MIVKFLYECRRCQQTHYAEPQPGETPADIMLRQVTLHQCEGTTTDGHFRFGISDLKGFNDTDTEFVP